MIIATFPSLYFLSGADRDRIDRQYHIWFIAIRIKAARAEKNGHLTSILLKILLRFYILRLHSETTAPRDGLLVRGPDIRSLLWFGPPSGLLAALALRPHIRPFRACQSSHTASGIAWSGFFVVLRVSLVAISFVITARLL